MRNKSFIVFLALFSFFLTPSVANGIEIKLDPFYLTGINYNDDVLDTALQPDGKLIVVGEFTRIVGGGYPGIARLNVDGTLDLSFKTGTGPNGNVFAVKLLSDGKILIGGNFSTFDGKVANRIARLNPDGSFDSTFNAGAGATFSVNSIFVQPDNRILVGGQFQTFGGVSRHNIVRLLADGTVDTSFNSPTGIDYFNPIYTIYLQNDGRILIGGRFTNSATGRHNVLRLNSNGSADSSFIGSTDLNSFTGVRSITARGDGKILIGGEFDTVNGAPRRGLGLVDSNGALDMGFIPTGIYSVTDIKVQSDGKILLSGEFPRPQGLDWSINRLNGDGSTDSSFQKNELGTANSIEILPDNKYLIAGYLTQNSLSVGGANPTGVRKLNNDGSRDNSYITRHGASEFVVSDLNVLPDGKILLLGGGSSVGGITRNGLARLLSNGSVDTNFAPTFGASAIAVSGQGEMFVGGVPSNFSGVYRFYKLNDDGTPNASFSAETGGSNPTGVSTVRDMAVQTDGKVIAVGNFETINGVNRRAIVRFNPDGSIDDTFNTNLGLTNAEIQVITIQPDGKILVAGLFQGFGGGLINMIFRLNPNGIGDPNFGYQVANNRIADLVYQNDGKILVTGFFTSISSAPKKGLARLNQNGTLDESFDPPVLTGSPNYIATALPLANGQILIGGEFFTVDGVNQRTMALLFSDGSVDTSFNAPVFSGSLQDVSKIVKYGANGILVAGDFAGIDSYQRYYSARFFVANKNAPYDFDGDGRTDISIFRPSGGEWWINRSSTNATVAAAFGTSTDRLVPGDYTGDGKADMAFWQPSNGTWYILRSENFTFYGFPFGSSGDVPLPGDFDGDSKTDAAVFRPSNNGWYIQKSSGGIDSVTFGSAGDVPVNADYDGDGKSDIAITRINGGSREWWIRRSSDGQVFAVTFGEGADKPVSGDYTGDGKADIAFFRPSTGQWFVLRSEDFSYYGFSFGISTDRPIPGDYDGDGKMDAAVFRSSNNGWYLLQSTQGFSASTFGTNGDVPVPGVFVR